MAECPTCKFPGADVLLNSVRCMNKECIHYNKDWVAERLNEEMDSILNSMFPDYSEPSKTEQTDPDITPLMWVLPENSD